MAAIPSTVEKLLDWWLHHLQPILSENLHSVVLFGSVTLDDFQPGWSDVDACVVLRRPITESEAQGVGQIHDEMKKRFAQKHEAGWTSPQVIEGPYVPLSLALGEIDESECFYAGGKTRR